MARSLAPIAIVWFGVLASANPADAQGQPGLGTGMGLGAGMGASSGPGTAPGMGVSGTSVAGTGQPGTIIGGPPGASVGRSQPSLMRAPTSVGGLVAPAAPPAALPSTPVTTALPIRPGASVPEEDDPLHPEGITLDEAVCRTIRDNLDLRARFSNITQADADVLTASLRTNPIVYTDAQGVPYGSYSTEATGGPTVFDINVVHPVDLSGKRKARTRVAAVNRRIVEANYRDAVRLTVDNLYGAYVDALSAQKQYDRATGALRGDVLTLASVDEPTQGLWETQRKLALLINLPAAEVARRQLKGKLSLPADKEPMPEGPDSVRIALEERPDLVAQRLTICLADASVDAVLAGRFDDVLLLYQPFTGRSGAPFGQPNRVAWAVGITVPLPIYNRQQGNIIKARQAAEQARIVLASMEKSIASEVQGAYLEHEAAHLAWIRTFDEFRASVSRPAGLSRQEGLDPELKKKLEALEKQVEDLRRDSRVDKLNKAYAASVRHRKSLLKINTVIGRRLVP
jgi:cobalt-zinc-cadmium efflux system outer membrane protein